MNGISSMEKLSRLLHNKKLLFFNEDQNLKKKNVYIKSYGSFKSANM